MKAIVSVGSAPSSGSTFLADLLDCAPRAVCPPELYMLCAPRAFAFDTFFQDRVIAGDWAIPNASIYGVPRLWFNRKYYDVLGLDDARFADLVRGANDLEGFITNLSAHLSTHLDRSIDVFFEKTPVNIGTADQFLSTFDNGHFVEVVRNGFSVVRSLLKRGFSAYEGALIWLYSIHRIRSLHHERIRQVSYEKLVADPFGTTVDLLTSMDIAATSDELKRNFHDNAFRAQLSRPATWSHSAMSLPPSQGDSSPWADLPEETVALIAHAVLHDTSRTGETAVLDFRTAMTDLGYDMPSVSRPTDEALLAAETTYRTTRKDHRWHPYRLSFAHAPLGTAAVGFPVAGATNGGPVFTL